MKIYFLLIAFITFITSSTAQRIIEHYTPQKGGMRYGEGKNDVFEYGSAGYTLALPGGDIKGVIISLEDYAPKITDSTKSTSLYKEAGTKGLAVLHIATGIPVDLFFSETSLQFVDNTLGIAFLKHHIPNKNIFFQGVMTAGHRALKYIEYCKKGKSAFKPDIKGVFLSESAIDWVRQWYEGQKQVRDHLTESGFFEGNLVSYLFKKHLRDTPITNMKKYIQFSAYSYFDTKMQKIALFKDISVRAYTFADTDYWFSAPGKGVYDSNYPDMSGFINELKLAGNKRAELIVFQKENKTGHHTKQSDTWKMVDKVELVEWVVKQID